MRIIDLTNDPRRAHFDYFRSLAYPYVGVTVPVDVTDLRALCKTRGYSFYLTFLHAVAFAADGVPELRRRILDGKIVEYDACPSSHTELLENGAYCYCTLRHDRALSLEAWLGYAEQTRKACRENASIAEDEDVLCEYFISALPWLPYTSLVQPVAGGDESNPRISWGKFEPNARGRLLMPVSILVHHALADGLHLAKFYENLDKELKKLILDP